MAGVGWGWGGPEKLVCTSPCVHEGRRGARGAAPGGEGSSGSVSGLLALFRGGFSRAPAACGLGCTLSCCAEARGRSCARSAWVRHLPAGLGRSPCRQVRSCKASGLKALLWVGGFQGRVYFGRPVSHLSKRPVTSQGLREALNCLRLRFPPREVENLSPPARCFINNVYVVVFGGFKVVRLFQTDFDIRKI